MPAPALNIPIRANLDKFKQDMQSTSTLAGVALRHITTNVIQMNAGWLASQGALGGATLAFGRLLPVVGQVILAYKAVKGAIDLMNYATDLAKAKIAEFNGIAEKANASGFSTDFFQRITKGGATAVVTINDLTDALKQFNNVSTPKLGGSDLQKRIDQLKDAGNFAGNTGIGALAGSNNAQERLKAVVDLIDQAMQKGERLAALDIATAAFGPAVTTALRADSGYLDAMLQRANALSATKIISEEDVGRAIELKERMDAAQKTLADKWKPVQDDIAKLGMNYHESWVAITEDLAAAVGYATQLYTALKQVPDWFANRIGNASIWKSLTDATGAMGLNSVPDDLVTDPAQIRLYQAQQQLNARLQNHANVTRGMTETSDIVAAVRGDTSKAPGKGQTDTADQFDRASEAIQKHTARLEADTQAVGLGAAAQEEMRAQAQLLTAAQQAGIPITDKVKDQIQDLAQDAGDAAAALQKARIASSIDVDRQTAFLTPDDAQIAKQLAGIYGNDIPAALASAEAAQMRFNKQLKQTSDLGQDVNRGLFVDFETGLRNGKNAWDAFRDAGVNALGKIADKLTSMAADNLWKAAFGGTSGGFGGLLGNLFGFGGSSAAGSVGVVGAAGGMAVPTFFASGGYTGPGGKYEAAGIVHRGEYVMDAATTSRIGVANLDRMRGYAAGGYVGGPAPTVGSNSPQNLNINVNVMGARGNQEIHDMVQQGVTSGLNSFVTSSQFPEHVALANKKVGTRRLT